MKLPPRLRRWTRRSIGIAAALPIGPDALHDLAAREPVLVIAVGIVNRPATDPRLPGDQRSASLGSLASAIHDVPRSHAIALHCG